jgi:hypothetical protein
MTGGSRLSAAAGAGERSGGLAALLGRLGRAAVLGCRGEGASGLRRGRTRPKSRRGVGRLLLAGLQAELG